MMGETNIDFCEYRAHPTAAVVTINLDGFANWMRFLVGPNASAEVQDAALAQ
jgi:hypothetical protein